MQPIVRMITSQLLLTSVRIFAGASPECALPCSAAASGCNHPSLVNSRHGMTVPPGEQWLPEPKALWTATSSSTSTASPHIKAHPPPAPPRGLSDCTSTQPSNPLIFAMQTIVRMITSQLLLTSVRIFDGASPECALPCPAAASGCYHPSLVNSRPGMTVPPGEQWLPEPKALWTATPSSTSTASPHIKAYPPPAPPRGLCDCTSTQPCNPLIFAMQVNKSYTLFAKKSSNYVLVQFPSPRCFLAIAAECVSVIHSLPMLSGDVETNPGPSGNDAVLTELQKIAAGQSKVITEVVQSLKSQLNTTDRTITDLCKRMTDLEAHYQALIPLRNDIEKMPADTSSMSRKIEELEDRLDDTENRSRRNNLIFYGISDPTDSETWNDSEKLIIDFCSNNLGITVGPHDFERAHPLGRHSLGRNRPIIVKFACYKTKDSILRNGRKLRNTNLSIGEDFSLSVRHEQKQLIAFAKAKSVKFSMRYKTLHIGPKRYVFDKLSSTVKEIA
ncbi:uncharacterized protein LOC125756977 [Rhipicephalus sanguineus]|uniref:uncharacterized protein LOC125756977 n=1 Tax=Rhipicephalus sanguineus TaxID=34632 RepID=UPI0020C4243E|nr:uncharacterized protein LOC125756977 [Rhipicephalus sanguineus]